MARGPNQAAVSPSRAGEGTYSGQLLGKSPSSTWRLTFVRIRRTSGRASLLVWCGRTSPTGLQGLGAAAVRGLVGLHRRGGLAVPDGAGAEVPHHRRWVWGAVRVLTPQGLMQEGEDLQGRVPEGQPGCLTPAVRLRGLGRGRDTPQEGSGVLPGAREGRWLPQPWTRVGERESSVSLRRGSSGIEVRPWLVWLRG